MVVFLETLVFEVSVETQVGFQGYWGYWVREGVESSCGFLSSSLN